MRKLIIGAIYKHKSNKIIWMATGRLALQCLKPGYSGYMKGSTITIRQDDNILDAPSIYWKVILPFNKYYEALQE